MQHALSLPNFGSLAAGASRLRSAPLARTALALAALAVGVVLRGLQLARPGLHPDEALYASWALRIADGSDPALLGVYVDKPPLLPYLLAGLFRLAGFDGAAPLDVHSLILPGRLAALLASSASLALLWLIARRVYGPRVAFGALLLAALSPLAVRLSPTLFTDPWLVLWMLVGLWAALEKRPWLAGIACGLAYATKQQALLLIPLILAALLLNARWPLAPSQSRSTSLRRPLWRWLNGFAVIAVLVLWWDSLRWQWMPSYWDRSAETYGGLALAFDAGLTQRLAQWVELLGYSFGWPLWLALAALAGWSLLARRSRMAAQRNTLRWFDGLLLAFTGGYLLLHLATNLAPWDRYLLPLIPVLALLLARVALWSTDSTTAPEHAPGGTGWPRIVLSVALILGLIYAGVLASFGRLPLADGGLYDGVEPVAAHVRIAEPPGAILYHHWLGWHYGFYLYDASAELRYWQEPVDLARKALASADQRQLIAFPAGRDQEPARAALAGSGLTLVPVMVAATARGAPSVTLYSIEPVQAGTSDHAP